MYPADRIHLPKTGVTAELQCDPAAQLSRPTNVAVIAGSALRQAQDEAMRHPRLPWPPWIATPAVRDDGFGW
jgi:hypothetical protein